MCKGFETLRKTVAVSGDEMLQEGGSFGSFSAQSQFLEPCSVTSWCSTHICVLRDSIRE